MSKMYSFIIKAFPFENNKYKIRFSKGQEEQFLETVINKVIYWDFEDFGFDLLLNINNWKYFKLKLSKDFISQIVIELNPKIKDNKYQIELRTKDYNKENKKILIMKKEKEKEEEEIKLNIVHNDLNLGKIMILNSDLNFKLFLVDLINQEIKSEVNKYEKINDNSEKLEDKTNKNLKIKNKEEKSNDYEYLLGKKVKKENKEIEKTKEIKFKINQDIIKGDEILFCLHILKREKIIMTIHNLLEKETEDYLDIEYTTFEDLKKLEEEIISKIKTIKNEVKNSRDLKHIDYTVINSKYNDNIVSYKLQNLEFDEKHFLAFINYCYKYISSFIKDIIEKIFKNYECYFLKYEQFGKEIILDLLSKFEFFNEYYKKILGKQSAVQNLIIKKNNLSYKEKAEVLSSILTIILNSPKFSTNMNIEFFEIESNIPNVYYDAKEFILKIINELKGDSILNNGYLKTFSRIKEDINEVNKKYYLFSEKKVFIIELINLNELKQNLKDYLPTKIVRYLNTKTKIGAQYDIFSENILINELIFIKRQNDFLNNDDNKIFNNLDNLIKKNFDLNNEEKKIKYDLCIFRTLWKFNHEAFGHKPVSKINKGRANTPNKTIINGLYKNTKDAGEIIEKYIYESMDELSFDTIKSAIFNPKDLLKVNLYIQKSFDDFWEVFSNIEINFGNEEEEIEGETQFFYKIAGLLTDNINKDDKYLSNIHVNYKKNNKLIFERFKI